MQTIISEVDRVRRAHGFIGITATTALAARGVTVFDPFSTLVSADAVLDPGIVLWPNVVVQVLQGGSLRIAAGTVLFSGTRIVARGGHVTIGREVEIGEEGGFTIRADAPDIAIAIGDGARLVGGGSLALANTIGRGAQVLGPIGLQNCRLGDGGSYREPDPDLRGGVLKGSGIARGIDVPRGHVIQAFGLFNEAPLRRQSHFHPKTTT